MSRARMRVRAVGSAARPSAGERGAALHSCAPPACLRERASSHAQPRLMVHPGSRHSPPSCGQQLPHSPASRVPARVPSARSRTAASAAHPVALRRSPCAATAASAPGGGCDGCNPAALPGVGLPACAALPGKVAFWPPAAVTAAGADVDTGGRIACGAAATGAPASAAAGSPPSAAAASASCRRAFIVMTNSRDIIKYEVQL